ncbi:amino acid transporter [Microbacterium sp. 18062]|uniref:amino acid transporter n=1 Tax=Microbacterium sp. 18062 TaxID=2681410 RepID=UPI0027D1E9B4|nr:amino acid transporter [Microbacterium sp. 18062]
MTDKPSRRDLMKPVQLLGLAFVAAVFAGVVTLVSMGFFQRRFDGQSGHALMVGAIVAGITFIATLVVIALLVLAVDPADVAKTVDRPVLLPKDAPDPDAAPAGPASPGASGAADAPGSAEDPASDDDSPRSDS